MGFLDAVIGAALGRKASPAPSQAPQSAPVQHQFWQIAAAQELLAPKQEPLSGQVAAPALVVQQSSSGLGVLLRQRQQNSFGEISNSWIGRGRNQPISPTLRRAMGQNTVNDLALQTGAPQDELLALLPKYPPGIIDRLTPNGQLSSQVDLRSR